MSDNLSTVIQPHAAAANGSDRTLAQLCLALLGEDGTPREITPLSWLQSLIEECRQRGPAEDDEDPQAFFEMLRECEALLQGVGAALAGAGHATPSQSSCCCPKAGSW